MSKKAFILVLFVLVIISLNFCVAQEVNNVTDDDSSLISAESDNSIAHSDQTVLKSSSPIKTQIDVKSNTTFDVVGDYFQVKLSDDKGSVLKNTKVYFTVSGNTYTKTTNNYGIASLKLNLNDGSYKIATKFLGNSKYKASSKTTSITIRNTIAVEDGLSSMEIQKIIDGAKDRNVILFKGSSYSNINLVLSKRLTLLSRSNTILKSGNDNPVFIIRGKSASLTTINGFNIQGNGNGISIVNSDYIRLINNKISTKSNAIVANAVKYLNITKNNIVQNSKNGVVIVNSDSAYIIGNIISNNGVNGIELANSTKIYIHGNTIYGNGGNGIYTSDRLNRVDYGSAPENLHIIGNTITKNSNNGIYILRAGDNVNIKGNVIDYNGDSGISLTSIGDNMIQSNEIASNGYVGIEFNDEYLKPESQDISYNALFGNRHIQVEAKDVEYSFKGGQLELGDNWYSDKALVCPKIKTNRIQFSVTQIGKNKFQASFVDSNGKIASLLPDRTLTYTTNNGKSATITVKGGSGVFTVDANNGDIIKAVVDYSPRENVYDSNVPVSNPSNGVTPSYPYPDIPYGHDDMSVNGKVNGNGNGNGNGNNEGSGNSGQGFSQSGDNGNSTYNGQQNSPGDSANNPSKDVSNAYESESSASAQSAVGGGSGDSSSIESKSVVKQIIIDEDEFFRVTGMSFIVLLMILTIGYYYRDDIKEMNSKR